MHISLAVATIILTITGFALGQRSPLAIVPHGDHIDVVNTITGEGAAIVPHRRPVKPPTAVVQHHTPHGSHLDAIDPVTGHSLQITPNVHPVPPVHRPGPAVVEHHTPHGSHLDAVDPVTGHSLQITPNVHPVPPVHRPGPVVVRHGTHLDAVDPHTGHSQQITPDVPVRKTSVVRHPNHDRIITETLVPTRPSHGHIGGSPLGVGSGVLGSSVLSELARHLPVIGGLPTGGLNGFGGPFVGGLQGGINGGFGAGLMQGGCRYAGGYIPNGLSEVDRTGYCRRCYCNNGILRCVRRPVRRCRLPGNGFFKK